ncbi:MAG: hypothetical protein O7D98_00745 [Candidatus Dadabacteria bacterium]|nr:hypothetical protein [Candidatus Dadabacteria bacterium]
MNLGGIIISLIELEKVINSHKAVAECAAVFIQRKGELIENLVVFVVVNKEIIKEKLLLDLKRIILKRLNPLIKIHDLLLTENLLKTAFIY